jgi:hypothetical protein
MDDHVGADMDTALPRTRTRALLLPQALPPSPPIFVSISISPST